MKRYLPHGTRTHAPCIPATLQQAMSIEIADMKRKLSTLPDQLAAVSAEADKMRAMLAVAAKAKAEANVALAAEGAKLAAAEKQAKEAEASAIKVRGALVASAVKGQEVWTCPAV